MSELRQDRTTGGWVIIAPQRQRRPRERVTEERSSGGPQRFDPACPFCPGHEAELPGIVVEASAVGTPGWSVRVVPNKFPALRPQTNMGARACRRHHALPGYGIHEVVIESARHDADLATMPKPEMFAVVSMYRRRFQALLEQPGIETVVLFRNHGPQGGASLAHPHSQIIAFGLAPPRLNALIETGLRHFRERGHCATCEELDIECQDGKRIVDANAQFIAFVPFAAEHPFELWIVPKRHQASFTEVADAELGDFTDLLGRSLQRLKAALDDPPYNFVIDSALRSDVAAPHIHWRLRIVPGILVWGGFELGAGLPINLSRPEDDASALRAVQMRQSGSQ
jgi:UDPglucose--hexose-1-phosphate uridylyltransferase